MRTSLAIIGLALFSQGCIFIQLGGGGQGEPGCRVPGRCTADTGRDAGPKDAGPGPLDIGIDGDVDAGPLDIGVDAGDSGDVFDGTVEDAGGCPEEGEHPEGEASFQQVTFIVTNSDEVPLYIAVWGWFCDVWGIKTAAGTRLPLTLGFECGCECANPGSPGVERYLRLEPGQSYTFSWSGLRLATYTSYYDCNPDGWGDYCVETTAGVPVRVAAGDYVLDLGYVDQLPDGCWEEPSSEVWCDQGYGYGGDWYDMPSSPQEICPDMLTRTTGFTLPESGDVEVEVVLTAAP